MTCNSCSNYKPRWKVGDRVRLDCRSAGLANLCGEYFIQELEKGVAYPVAVTVTQTFSHPCYRVRIEDLQPVAEPRLNISTKFKVGDRVRSDVFEEIATVVSLEEYLSSGVAPKPYGDDLIVLVKRGEKAYTFSREACYSLALPSGWSPEKMLSKKFKVGDRVRGHDGRTAVVVGPEEWFEHQQFFPDRCNEYVLVKLDKDGRYDFNANSWYSLLPTTITLELTREEMEYVRAFISNNWQSPANITNADAILSKLSAAGEVGK